MGRFLEAMSAPRFASVPEQPGAGVPFDGYVDLPL